MAHTRHTHHTDHTDDNKYLLEFSIRRKKFRFKKMAIDSTCIIKIRKLETRVHKAVSFEKFKLSYFFYSNIRYVNVFMFVVGEALTEHCMKVWDFGCHIQMNSHQKLRLKHHFFEQCWVSQPGERHVKISVRWTMVNYFANKC